MTVREKIKSLGLCLPPPPRPLGAYLPVIRTGNLVFTSGQLPSVAGELIVTGKVPTEVTLGEAQAAAAQAVLNGLAAIEDQIDSLDEIRQIVRVNVFVNSDEGFHDQAAVANGASELLVRIFGEAGQHTRCAIGAAQLPLNSPVELDMLVEV